MLDIQTLPVAIRDAVAPVFLLTGVGSMLAVLVGRLARSVDRARLVQERETGATREKIKGELALIVQRIKWLRLAIGLATLGAFSICVSIVTLFIAVETGWQLAAVVLWSFIGCMGSIILALLCFIREILLTSKEVIVTSKLD